MWNRSLSFAVILALTLATSGGRADARAALSYDVAKIDPALLSQVLANPKADYDVIVRAVPDKTKVTDDRAGRAGAEVANAGGKARHALGIVGGASARISGDKLLGLTASAKVDYVFADAPLVSTWDPAADADKATTAGIKAINAPQAWTTYNVTGRGIGVAVVDSGIYAHPDIAGRIAAQVDLTASTVTTTDALTNQITTTTVGTVGLGVDPGGHGTHVAGLIAGNGASSGGAYTGVAPDASLVDVRVIRSDGTSNTGIVLRGMQWVLANRVAYNIKVVNLSLGAPVTKSYKLDPLATGAEVLTFAGITVVVSAGNSGPTTTTITAPANDPFVITVGAVDDNQTAETADDTIASFSSRGKTKIDNGSKPDVSAPGRRMVSLRAPGSALDTLYPERRVAGTDPLGAGYFTLSGTSMSAPVVAGTIALMLERNATLVPSQIKKRLKDGAVKLAGATVLDQGAGRIDVLKTVGAINADREYSEGRVSDSFAKDMRKFVQGQPLAWNDRAYNGGVDSHNITWDNITWDNITWDNVTWDNLSWENLSWENISWESLTWENISWESSDTLSYHAQTGSGWILVD
jgi:serine protease AprX